MSGIPIHDDVEEVLFSREQIAQTTERLGSEVARDYAELKPVIAPILKGGFVVAADLIRALHPVPPGMEIEFVHASSYGAAFKSSGKVDIKFNTDAIKGRHVLMVDDLADTGLTLAEVKRELLEAGAASVKALVLLDKAERRNVDISLEYIGFTCPNRWVVGHGMDTAQIYRSLPYIGVLKKEAQAKFMK